MNEDLETFLDGCRNPGRVAMLWGVQFANWPEMENVLDAHVCAMRLIALEATA